MEQKNLNEYITEAYARWVEYAYFHVRQTGLQINPSEVVNDILCSFLERDTSKLERMVNTPANGATELDFFILRFIKISIHFPHSSFRYQRGQHCTTSLSEDLLNMPDETTSNDKDEIHLMIWNALGEIEASITAKQIFIWKFFDGNSLSQWPGRENKKFVYRSYHDVLIAVIRQIKVKLIH